MFSLSDTLENIRSFLDNTLAEYGLKQEDLENCIAANTNSDKSVNLVMAVKAFRKLTLPVEFRANEGMAQVLRDRGYDVRYEGEMPLPFMGLRDAVWVVQAHLMLRAISFPNVL